MPLFVPFQFCQHAPGHHVSSQYPKVSSFLLRLTNLLPLLQELKEACKSFEKVLVQNIQFGLKPELIESIRTIPRWKLIQAALPHVMHCTAALLFNRMKDGSIQTLGAVETKLLYTMHWIILDAAEECADADYEMGIYHSTAFYYLFSVPTISVGRSFKCLMGGPSVLL